MKIKTTTRNRRKLVRNNPPATKPSKATKPLKTNPWEMVVRTPKSELYALPGRTTSKRVNGSKLHI
ncbi:hypothetical protein D8674_003567 [Pyrus ussuriensis x Pyrus communis]|uniref:Uncharacterized protein n=1 Tax=Pyrus ussuriensis x Pyrus communis TaxID=2448454 RepID=A0A5N5FMX9_9ROSA|nr:hypothetical protein D8674_003567 [Pyrus ussuriensis x Pyrus communis]